MHKAVRIEFCIDSPDILKIELRNGNNKLFYVETLTIGQGFDIMLIRTLDKMFRRNKIDRLSLKSVEIRGEMPPNALSSMILQTVARTLAI